MTSAFAREVVTGADRRATIARYMIGPIVAIIVSAATAIGAQALERCAPEPAPTTVELPNSTIQVASPASFVISSGASILTNCTYFDACVTIFGFTGCTEPRPCP